MDVDQDLNKGTLEISLKQLGSLYLVKERTEKKGPAMNFGGKTRLVESDTQQTLTIMQQYCFYRD